MPSNAAIRPIRILLITLLLGIVLQTTLVQAASAWQWEYSTFADKVSKEVVVGVGNMPSKSYTDMMGLIAKYGGKVVNNVSFRERVEAIVVSLPQSFESSFIEETRATAAPDYIEPNVRFKIDFVPNDPYWSAQWGPKKISADYAWNTTIGSSSILVAVVDTGVDWTHPDLAANYMPLGYNWVDGNSYPMDDNGHGTHVAGILAAVINNGLGVAGLSQAKIMAEKGLDRFGYGYEADLANAIVHAVNHGAKIINMSWGDYANSSLIQNSIRFAYNSGALLVAAAGNDNTGQKLYPAAYDEVIAVSATDQYDNKAWFSNFGNWVEVAAPGINIYSTLPNNGYGYKSGTSMATPFVSGVTALIWSRFPGITRDQVRMQIRQSSDDLGAPGFDIYYGYGRVNASRAVESFIAMRNIAITDVSAKSVVGQGFDVRLNVTAANQGDRTENFSVALYANNTTIQTQAITLTAGNSTILTFSWNTTGFAKGKYVMSAYASLVPNETNVTDNTFIDGVVIVAMVGDITGSVLGVPDGKVDIRDIATVAIAYGSHPGYQNWNPNADINDDNKVDVKDLAIATKNFGKADL